MRKSNLALLFVIFAIFSNNIHAGSSKDYYRSALINGNQAYKYGDLERALFLWEICANQYNPSIYQKTCRKNISYLTIISNTEKIEVTREIKRKIAPNNISLFGTLVD